MKINVKSLTTVMSDKGLENIEMISVRPASSPSHVGGSLSESVVRSSSQSAPALNIILNMI